MEWLANIYDAVLEAGANNLFIPLTVWAVIYMVSSKSQSKREALPWVSIGLVTLWADLLHFDNGMWAVGIGMFCYGGWVLDKKYDDE